MIKIRPTLRTQVRKSNPQYKVAAFTTTTRVTFVSISAPKFSSVSFRRGFAEQNPSKFGDKESIKKDEQKHSKSEKNSNYFIEEINPGLRIGTRLLPEEDRIEVFMQLNEADAINKGLLDTITHTTKEALKHYGPIGRTMENVKHAAEKMTESTKIGSKVSEMLSSAADATISAATKVASSTGIFSGGGNQPEYSREGTVTKIPIPSKGTIMIKKFNQDPKSAQSKEKENKETKASSEKEHESDIKWDELSYAFQKTKDSEKLFDPNVAAGDKTALAVKMLVSEFTSIPIAGPLAEKLTSMAFKAKEHTK